MDRRTATWFASYFGWRRTERPDESSRIAPTVVATPPGSAARRIWRGLVTRRAYRSLRWPRRNGELGQPG